MTQLRNWVGVALLVLAGVLGAGCAQLDIEGVNTPANVKAFAARVPVVENSTHSPCWQQRQIARQQAFLASTIEGKVVVRRVACGQKKQQANAS